MERVLKALANRRRLALLRLLKRGERMNVSALARAIHLSVRATSQHLVMLHRIGVVNREQTRLEVFYSLRDKLPRVARDVLKEL